MNKHQLVSFAECDLWQKQKPFYQAKKLKAWEGLLPFYATSNPYIANNYAQIIIRFIQDLLYSGKCSPTEPFYILELGTGHGAFSYYLLKALAHVKNMLKLETIKIHYIMSDAIDYMDFWQSQPQLQPYIEQGEVDFALVDMEEMKDIYLIKAAKTLTEADFKNPLITIANYLIDSLRHDFFRVAEQKLKIARVKADLKIDNSLNNICVPLTKIDPDFCFTEINLPYYQDEYFNAILSHYQRNFSSITFTFPVGALLGIDNLIKLTNNNILLLVSDKGAVNQDILTNYEPDLVVHEDAFSMMVNFYALREYIKYHGGDSYYQSIAQEIITSIFVLGHQFADLTETQQAIDIYIEKLPPSNLLSFRKHINRTSNFCSLDMLLTYFSNSFWDDQIFNTCLPSLMNIIKTADKETLENLLNGLKQIAANYYYLPGAVNTLFNIGIVLQETKCYHLALEYYQCSLPYNKDEDVNTFYNMALCCYHLQDYKEALHYFKKVITLDPEHILAEGWLNYICQWHYQPI